MPFEPSTATGTNDLTPGNSGSSAYSNGVTEGVPSDSSQALFSSNEVRGEVDATPGGASRVWGASPSHGARLEVRVWRRVGAAAYDARAS